MVLKLADAPPEGIEAVSDALAGLAAARRAGRKGFAGESAPPVPIYVLAPEALDQARPLAEAVHAGWHYVARQGRLQAAVELALTKSGGLRLSRIRPGRRAQAVLRAARRAEACDRDDETFEVRLLRLPPLHLEALWLAGVREDRFLPLDRRRKAFPLLDEARNRRGLRWAGIAAEGGALSD